MYFRRHALTRAESRELLQQRMMAKQGAMTPSQVRELMRRTIHEALNRGSNVTRRDLELANVPGDAIDRLFEGILITVKEQRAKGVFQ